MVIVGAVSAGIALLFAPKSGKLLREDIKAKGIEAKDIFNESKDNLVSDFKQSYSEAERDVELELEIMDNRQRELRETIHSIENDLHY